jgi:hypothetical protein
MASPIILKAWFNNVVTGLPFTTLFANYRKSKDKSTRLANAIANLVQIGILQAGIGHNRHIVTARKETYMKVPPIIIRSNTDMLDYLQSIGIDLNSYEHFYLSSPLPANMELTDSTVNMILSDDNYIEICHLFNDARIQKQMEERLSQRLIQYRMVQGRKQYYIPTSSQVIDQRKISLFF